MKSLTIAGGEGLYASFADAREQLSQLASRELPTGVDFLLDCSMDVSTGGLRVCAGTSSGDVLIYSLDRETSPDCILSGPRALLQDRHTEVGEWFASITQEAVATVSNRDAEQRIIIQA